MLLFGHKIPPPSGQGFLAALEMTSNGLVLIRFLTWRTTPFSQPTAKTFSLIDLVAAASAGRLRIPEFQRPLRWQWKDVSRLFDSIVKGYPIGNLLL